MEKTWSINLGRDGDGNNTKRQVSKWIRISVYVSLAACNIYPI